MPWPLGNEAGNGVNFYKTLQLAERMDSRPVQYEQAHLEWNTDICCPMLPPCRYRKYAKNPKHTRPLILCEYAHAMGNSLGNFRGILDIIRNTLFCRWLHLGLGGSEVAEKTADGRKYWRMAAITVQSVLHPTVISASTALSIPPFGKTANHGNGQGISEYQVRQFQEKAGTVDAHDFSLQSG